MLLFSLAFTQKYLNPTGYQFHLPGLRNQVELDNFLKTHEYSFISFQSNLFLLNWMDYAIYRYRDEIGFVEAQLELGKQFNCSKDPCFMAFHKHEPIEPPAWATRSPVHFANWIGQLSHPNYYRVETKESLRILLDDIEEDIIFAVDQDITKRPSFIPENEFIVSTTTSAFEQYNITTITPGYYYYRFDDRQFLPYTGTFEKSLFIDVQKVNVTTKPYIALFVYNPKNAAPMQEGLDVMNELVKDPQYSEKIAFSIGEDEPAAHILRQASLRKATLPFFAFIDTSNFKTRWVAQEGDEKNISYVKNLIEIGMENKTEPTWISQKPFTYPQDLTFRQISSAQFNETVMDPNYDVVFSLTAYWCGHCANYKPIANVTSMALKGQPVKFYWMEGTKNEFPSEIPPIPGFPAIFLYPMHNKSNVYKFFEYGSIREIIQTLNEHNMHNYTYVLPKDFDERKANHTIKEIRRSYDK